MFDVYDIPDALNPEVIVDPSIFLNGLSLFKCFVTYLSMLLPDPQTRAAIHAPTSVDWSANINYPFANSEHADRKSVV